MTMPLAAIFGVALLACAVLLTPLRMALGWLDADRAGLSAQRVSGSIWAGALAGANFRGLALGDVEARVAPLSGGLWLQSGGPIRGEGVLRPSVSGVAVRGLTARLPLAAIAPEFSIQGDAALSDIRAAFRDGRCAEAGGEVRLEALRLGPMQLAGLTLAGRAVCQGGVWTVPLVGQAGGLAIDARLGVRADGAYRLETRLRAADPLVGAAAGAAGFARGLDGYTRTVEGRLGA
jgi:hypothetical protein